jgi:hypothetical protein
LTQKKLDVYRGMMESKLLFEHVPKSGGTTVGKILKDYYRSKRIPVYYIPNIRSEEAERYAALPVEERSIYFLIYGHGAYRLMDHIPGDVACITLLRDPIRRILSEFNYIHTKETHYLHGRVVDAGMSFKAFLQSGLRPHVENFTTRTFSRLPQKAILKDPQAALDLAISNLERDFIHIGLLEQFDLSLILLKRKLHWDRYPFYLKENISKRRVVGPEDIDSETMEILRDKNQLDLQLYELVSKRFSEEVQAGGESLVAEVEEFQNALKSRARYMVPQKKIRDLLIAGKLKLTGK